MSPQTPQSTLETIKKAIADGKLTASAAKNLDAWLTTVHIGDLGLCYLDGVELDELRYPLRVLRRGIEPDSEGAGRFRGAPAGFCEYGPVGTSMVAWFASDGTINAPQGVRGGRIGACVGDESSARDLRNRGPRAANGAP